MVNYKEKFYKYPDKRDVLFVFGAGASYADGAPLMTEIIPIIISDEFEDIGKSEIGRTVREFIKDNFAYSPASNSYPTLEAVFGFLDYFIIQKEHLNTKYSNEKIHNIREALIQLIHYVISEKTTKGPKTYRSFWEAIRKYNRNISILTLNYDTLLEDAFDFMYPDYGYIDYCIHLMNYDMPDGMAPFDWWINPREPFPVWGGGDPVPIKIMKAHGSLNWKYCNCCNQVLLTPWDTKINLYSAGFLQYVYPHCDKPTTESYRYCCPIDGSEFETLILPPTHIKKLAHPIISQIFNEALREIRASKKVVFVGYSFPDSDVHFKALFKKGLLGSKEIIVVNIAEPEKMELTYKSLSKNIKFVNSSFTDVVSDKGSMAELLTRFDETS